MVSYSLHLKVANAANEECWFKSVFLDEGGGASSSIVWLLRILVCRLEIEAHYSAVTSRDAVDSLATFMNSRRSNMTSVKGKLYIAA